MEAEHESAGQALVEIRKITSDFQLPEYACVTYRALMSGLSELEQDLHMHIHLENNILFPRAVELEVSRR
jgi:regulator of cell morphogenesis and NO signaling